MADAASVVSILLTDIEGSSLKWLNHRAAMQAALATHDAMIRKAIADENGEVFKTAGDAFFAAFKTPAAAVRAAIHAQRTVAGADWSAVEGLRVRMAVHTGTAERRGEDYFGPALNRAARLLNLGHGGQILATDSVARLVQAEREAEAGLLLGRHALDDPTQPVEVYQIRAPGLPQEFPALRTRDTRPTNLTQQMSALIGRDDELRQLIAHLQSSRLVTVTGTGGVGKTRLAIEAGRRRLTDHTDGVWLVEFAPISDATLIASTVATALGLRLSSNVSPLQGLVNQLKAMDVLLILDNCEHVIGAVAELAEQLLSTAPRLRILATSQEQLGIAGEQAFPLPPLAVPGEGAMTAADALVVGSVQLFVELAKAASPRFVFNDRLAPTVGIICRRLDGVPLAIAMAAARAPALGVEKLSELLDQRFRVLTGGRRTALPRQQTLRATLDWSFGLLPERDKTVFRRMSVFAGGFTLEAASAVATDPQIDELDVIEAIASLLAKSLVALDADDVRTRYRLLETARMYALEKLAEAEESERLAHRHAQDVQTFFATCREDFWQLSDAAFLDRYRDELDNLRAAMEWAFAPGGDDDLGIALLGVTGELWAALSLNAELERRADVALRRVRPDTPPGLQAAAWFCRARALRERLPDAAIEAAQRAVTLYRTLDDPLGLAGSLALLFVTLARGGSTEALEGQIDELAKLATRLGSKRLMAEYELSLGIYLHIRREAEKAIASYEHAALFAQEAGAEALTLAAVGNAADAYWALQDLDRALAAARDAVAQIRQSRFARRLDLSSTLANLYGILVERGDVAEAEALSNEVLELLREVGLGWFNLDHFALAAAKRGNLEAAAKIAGYVTSASAAKQFQRQPNEARAHESTLDILGKQLAQEKLNAWLAQGASLDDDQACRLAKI